MSPFFRARSREDLRVGALAARLTAIALILLAPTIWYVRYPLIALAAAALLSSRLLRTPALWLAIAFFAAVAVVREWPLPDNHDYLLGYWPLAIGLALLTSRPDSALAFSARWIVAAIFVWATLWKAVLSPDYMDGTFYRVAILSDVRFSPASSLIGGLDAQDRAENRAYLERPLVGEDAEPRLHEPASLRRLATLLTWATVLLEAAVALAFLLPRPGWARHVALLAFCTTAYLLTPVQGFGWLLAIMGLAQVPPDRAALRGAYLAACFLILVYGEAPSLLLRKLGLIG